MLADTIFKLANLGYTINITPLSKSQPILGLSIHKDGLVNRAVVTHCSSSSRTEAFLDHELDFLEHSFDGLAVKEKPNESPD